MEISLEKSIQQDLTVTNTRDISEIQLVLTELLYVPDEKLKLVVVLELLDYLKEKFSKPDYKIEFFYTKEAENITGFVVCQIDKEYKSYGMKCPTFGWLHARDSRSCELLMGECEDFVREFEALLTFQKLQGVLDIKPMVLKLPCLTEWRLTNRVQKS